MAQGTVDRRKTFLGHYTSKLEAALARLTWEINCDKWKCNRLGELVVAIKNDWPEFNLRCI